MSVALTADIVGSRSLADRAGAQRVLDDTIARVEHDLPMAERPLRPTVGDEQQAVYPSLDTALAATLLLRLVLPTDVDCRFGLGIGALGEVPSAHGDIPDGPGWWAARAAIERVHDLQQRAVPAARTWVVAHESATDAAAAALGTVNAYLLARDQLIDDMTERTRRLTYGRCLGVTQRVLGEAEGITQSAVSQALATSGAASLVEGFALLDLNR